MPNKDYDKKKHLNIIIKALQKLNITTKINHRNDIVVDFQAQTYKLSGSAYRETKNTSFHHGTLLVNANLKALEKYLHHKIDPDINAKGVASVRSKVISIAKLNPKAANIDQIFKTFKIVL